jgi:hypothetical protein
MLLLLLLGLHGIWRLVQIDSVWPAVWRRVGALEPDERIGIRGACTGCFARVRRVRVIASVFVESWELLAFPTLTFSSSGGRCTIEERGRQESSLM